MVFSQKLNHISSFFVILLLMLLYLLVLLHHHWIHLHVCSISLIEVSHHLSLIHVVHLLLSSSVIWSHKLIIKTCRCWLLVCSHHHSSSLELIVPSHKLILTSYSSHHWINLSLLLLLWLLVIISVHLGKWLHWLSLNICVKIFKHI